MQIGARGNAELPACLRDVKMLKAGRIIVVVLHLILRFLRDRVVEQLELDSLRSNENQTMEDKGGRGRHNKALTEPGSVVHDVSVERRR